MIPAVHTTDIHSTPINPTEGIHLMHIIEFNNLPFERIIVKGTGEVIVDTCLIAYMEEKMGEKRKFTDYYIDLCIRHPLCLLYRFQGQCNIFKKQYKFLLNSLGAWRATVEGMQEEYLRNKDMALLSQQVAVNREWEMIEMELKNKKDNQYDYQAMEDKTDKLFLILTTKWFRMIESGIKKAEYRDYTDYWCTRLEGRKYDTIMFQLGYSGNERMTFKTPIITITKESNTEWGGIAGAKMFCIEFGARIK